VGHEPDVWRPSSAKSPPRQFRSRRPPGADRRTGLRPSLCSPDMAPTVLASTIRSHIEGLDLTLTMSDFGVLDIAPAQVDRATGVRQAIGGLGIRLEEPIAVGDMPNDLPMLRDAGLSVAMGNGHPDVISATDVVTTSVGDDGFAESLSQLGIINHFSVT